VKITKAGMFGVMKSRVVSLFKMAHNVSITAVADFETLSCPAAMN